MAEIHAFFYPDERFAAVPLHPLYDCDNEFSVNVGDLIDLFRVVCVGFRPRYGLLQIPTDLVLSEGVGERTLLGIN